MPKEEINSEDKKPIGDNIEKDEEKPKEENKEVVEILVTEEKEDKKPEDEKEHTKERIEDKKDKKEYMLLVKNITKGIIGIKKPEDNMKLKKWKK